MMSLCGNLAVLLLLLMPDSFLRYPSPLLPSLRLACAAPTTPPVQLSRILFAVGSDDDEDRSTPPSVSSTTKPPLLAAKQQPCPYNPCLEKQEPCTLLSAQTGCLCPGLSGDDQPPHAPNLEQLVPVSNGGGGGAVEIQWCAPASVVSGYRVVVEGRAMEALDFGEELRRGLVESLEVGAEVCVEAVNKAGHSEHSEFSCKKYNPPESSNHVLMAGVIGGGVAFLLIISMAAVILWKWQVCRKGKRDSTEGLGNPSYTTEGHL